MPLFSEIEAPMKAQSPAQIEKVFIHYFNLKVYPGTAERERRRHFALQSQRIRIPFTHSVNGRNGLFSGN
jgi:hypothetical protein